MNFARTIKDFFKAPQINPVAIAVVNAFSDANDAYDKAYSKLLAAPTEPTDFDPYTEAHLDTFTVAMDILTAAFDNLTTAFNGFNPTHELYTSAVGIYKATCVTYKFAADGYREAAHRALMTALQGNLQAVKDTFNLGTLEIKASNPASANHVVAKAEAAAFKAKATEDANKAKRLEQKATVAKTKAEVFLSKAKAAEAKAEEALETNQ
jgi:hypothetical protein